MAVVITDCMYLTLFTVVGIYCQYLGRGFTDLQYVDRLADSAVEPCL